MPSLGQQVDLTVTYLEIQTSSQFDSRAGRQEKLLESFCQYSDANNPPGDQVGLHLAKTQHSDILSDILLWAGGPAALGRWGAGDRPRPLAGAQRSAGLRHAGGGAHQGNVPCRVSVHCTVNTLYIKPRMEQIVMGFVAHPTHSFCL